MRLSLSIIIMFCCCVTEIIIIVLLSFALDIIQCLYLMSFVPSNKTNSFSFPFQFTVTEYSICRQFSSISFRSVWHFFGFCFDHCVWSVETFDGNRKALDLIYKSMRFEMENRQLKNAKKGGIFRWKRDI